MDIVHILVQTVQLCKISEYLYTDSLCDWISNGSQNTDICVLVDIGQITGQITEQIAGYGG